MDRLELAAALSVNFQNKFDYSNDDQHGMLADLSFKAADTFIAKQKAFDKAAADKAAKEGAK